MGLRECTLVLTRSLTRILPLILILIPPSPPLPPSPPSSPMPRPQAPAFSSWSLKPQPGNVTWARVRVPTVAGGFDISVNQTTSMDILGSPHDEAVTSNMNATSTTSIVVTVAPPANTQGRVCLPRLGSSSLQIVVDGHARNGQVNNNNNRFHN